MDSFVESSPRNTCIQPVDQVPMPIDKLPEAILDRLLSEIIREDPSLRLNLLSKLGSTLHASACRVLFRTIILEDDDRFFNPPSSLFKTSLQAIISNPGRYGSFVRTLEVVDSSHFINEGSTTLLLDMRNGKMGRWGEMKHDSSLDQPLTTQHLDNLLRMCPSLETLIWRSTNCPPDGICEMLSSYTPNLATLHYLPVMPLMPQAKLGSIKPTVRWDALSLPMLSSLGITSLQLSRLSHTGARSLANLLSLLEEEVLLEDVLVDTNWLDEHVCLLLGNACRKVKRLEVGSDGTRFSDKCIMTILSLCENLEQFALGDIQGRLSKHLWENIEEYPSSLRRVSIRISEYTLHHSWAIDHLASLHHLPLETLTHLTISRHFNPFVSSISEAAAMKNAPADFIHSLRRATQLVHLECDWWSWRPEDLKIMLEHCSSLRWFRMAFDGPFSKLLTLGSTFSTATALERLIVFVSDEHCPVVPPSPPISTHHVPSRSPSTSPVQRNRVLSNYVGAQDPFTDDKGNATQSMQLNSDHIPLRDVKKFAKRCPALREIIWDGKHGVRKQWMISRIHTTAQSGSNTIVESFQPYSEDLWNGSYLQRDLAQSSWVSEPIEREGAVWTGPNAEYYSALRASEKEKEDQMAKQEKASRAASKKGSQPPSLGIEVAFPKAATKSNTASPVDTPSEIPTPVSPVEPRSAPPSRKTPPRPRRRTNDVAETKPRSKAQSTPSSSPERPRAQSHTSRGMAVNGTSNHSGHARSSDRRNSVGGAAGSSASGYRRSSHPGQSTNSSTNNSSSRGGNPNRGRGGPRRSAV